MKKEDLIKLAEKAIDFGSIIKGDPNSLIDCPDAEIMGLDETAVNDFR